MRVDARIQALALTPRPIGAEALKGQDPPLYRLRVGDHRVIYAVDDKSRMVTVSRVRNRRDVYRNL